MTTGATEKLTLYDRSGEPVVKVECHKFTLRPEILIYSQRYFVWQEDRQHYSFASVHSALAPRTPKAGNAFKEVTLYDRAQEPLAVVLLPHGPAFPDVILRDPQHFVWKKQLEQYHEALVVRIRSLA